MAPPIDARFALLWGMFYTIVHQFMAIRRRSRQFMLRWLAARRSNQQLMLTLQALMAILIATNVQNQNVVLIAAVREFVRERRLARRAVRYIVTMYKGVICIFNVLSCRESNNI